MILAALLLAQASPAPCPAIDAKLPPALAGWTAPVATLSPGKAITLEPVEKALVLLRDIKLPDTPGKIALTSFTVTKAGTYGLALDQKAWIDVYPATGADALKSVAHGHGPQCSSIRKIVRFTLKPGRYRAMVSGIEKPAAKLMLVTD